MSHAKVPVRERLPSRVEIVASRLLLVAALIVHGLGSAAEAAAAPAMGPAPAIVAGSSSLLLVPPTTRDGWAARGQASAPPAPHHEAPRLGEGDCCNTSTCRCGCLYSVIGIAIAALGNR